MLNGVCTDRLGEVTVHLDAVLRCTSFDDALRDDLLGLVDIFTSGWVKSGLRCAFLGLALGLQHGRWRDRFLGFRHCCIGLFRRVPAAVVSGKLAVIVSFPISAIALRRKRKSYFRSSD